LTLHAITALHRHFTKISSKVRKLRRERERSDSTAVSIGPTAGQTMTEPEKFSDVGEILAVTVRLGVGAAERLFSHYSAVTHKPKVQDQHDAR